MPEQPKKPLSHARALPPSIRPHATPPAAVGRIGALMHSSLSADRAVRRVGRTVDALQSRVYSYAAREIVPLLDEARPAENAAAARTRLGVIPSLEDLGAAEDEIERALCGEPAGVVTIRVFITAMLAMKGNVKLADKEAYIEGLVFTIWDEQDYERYTASVIASAINYTVKNFTFAPEIGELLTVLCERRSAMRKALEAIMRLRDLRWNAQAIANTAAGRASDGDDGPIPF